MRRRASRALTILSILAIAHVSLPLAGLDAAAKAEISRADYDACQTTDDAAFRNAIQAITTKALSGGISTVDYTALVKDQWRDGDLDRIVDARIDIAVGEVRDETSWANLIKSLGSKEKAQELATEVAERVYRSQAMQTAIEGLAAGVAKNLGRNLELATVAAAEPVVRCLDAYLGPRYGSAIASFVAGHSEEGLGLAGEPGSADVTGTDILKQSKGGITGAAVLVLRRQMATMARRLGQRLVGSVLSRLVSVAAGGVGLVLIAKDIWDLRHGVLPIIADEMKSPATKEKVREELASVLSEQVREHVKEIAAKSADHVAEVWQSFRRAHAKALDLAEQDDRFKTYLNGLAAAALPRLDRVVALVLPQEGEAGIKRRLADGTLDRAVSHMPPPALEIAETSRSLETGLKWQAVAGDNIAAVVENELHLRARPDDFSSATLERILSLGDRLAVTRLAAVSRSARDTLFDLGNDELKSLSRSLSDTELEALAGYLSSLDKAPRERILKAAASEPGIIKLIAPANVRTAVLASRDQMAAVDMMLRPQGVFDPLAAYKDMGSAWAGRVSPILVWEKHPAAVIVLGLLALFVMMLLRRLLFPRRAALPHVRPQTGAETPPDQTASATNAGGPSPHGARLPRH